MTRQQQAQMQEMQRRLATLDNGESVYDSLQTIIDALKLLNRVMLS